MTGHQPHIQRVLDSFHGAHTIATMLAEANLQHVTEDDLQAAIQSYLNTRDVHPEREVRLSDGVSRIDLMVGRTGIEVKIDGSWANVIRQLTRYAKCPEIESLVLVTTRAKHHHLPDQLCNKPLSLVSLVGSAL